MPVPLSRGTAGEWQKLHVTPYLRAHAGIFSQVVLYVAMYSLTASIERSAGLVGTWIQ